MSSSFAQNIQQDSLFAQMYRKLYAMNSEGQYAEIITEGEVFLNNQVFNDTILLSYGNLLFVIGTGHYNYGTAEKAFWFTERALAIFTKLDHIRMVDAYDRLGECHYWYTQDYDKAIENCQKGIAIYESKIKDCTSRKSGIYANIGMINAAKLNYSEALSNYNKALACPNEDNTLAVLNMQLGDFYLRQSLYNKALIFFSKAEFHYKKFYKDNMYHPNLGAVYGNQATCYQYMGAYSKAITFFDKAKEIFEKKLDPNNPNILKAQAYLGFCYADYGQYNEAIARLQPLIMKNLDDEKGLKANVFEKLVYCYARTNQRESFNVLMPELIKHTESSTFSNLIDKENVYRNIAINYKLVKNYEQSSVFYKKALLLLDSLETKDEKSSNLIDLDLGYDAVDENKTEEAIQYFETILNRRTDKEDKKSLEYYYTIYGLSLAYYQKFEKIGDKLFLNKGIDLMDTSVNIIIGLRNDYIEQADKQYLNSDGNIVFDKLIEMLLRKNTLEADSNIVKRCFTLSEQNKSMRLLEAIKGIEIGKVSVLVDSIKGIKQTINKLENQIFWASKDTNKNVLEYLKSQLFEAKLEQESLVNTLKLNAEQDFKNLYHPDILSVGDIQQTLNTNQTLLEYFVGENSIFIFTINKDQFKVTEVKKDFPLEEWIQQMRVGIYGSFLNNIEDDSLTIRTKYYKEAATKLYDKLIAPVQNILRGSVIIVPDGVLSNISFDALLAEKPSVINRPQNFNYLLNKHKISYCYSATLLNEMVKKEHRQKPKEQFLAMVPAFENKGNATKSNKGNFDPLTYSKEEAIALQKIMGGDTLIGNKATKSFFTQNASNYRTIHLTTHGKMDDQIGDYSYLVFAQPDSSNENELLYTRELYNIQLNADMVVLSACETGIGELQGGEGVISLARAFAFAGSKSIVTTLWSVNDKATKELMILFYQNIKEGKSKDEALWLAKRAYITDEKNKGQLALPYYWSGIIPIGDMRPIGK